ncbi:MAG: ATP-binding protein, partial [Candidatus Nitrosocaldus sp.]
MDKKVKESSSSSNSSILHASTNNSSTEGYSSTSNTIDNTSRERLEALILSNPQQFIIGYDNYRNRFYAIPSSSRVHMLITGETGSGKSETLKLLIYQHILRREGFMLIDPHGSLARSVLKLLREKLIEEEFNKEVIYINPEVTNWKINPLEIKDYSKSHVVVMSFISALKNLYDYAWGDRLETILRNTINLVVESDPPCTLAKIAKVLADSKYRDMLVKGSVDKDMEYFWYSVYPNYAREAFTAVYNKLDKLLFIASVRKTFNVEVSNLDIEEA